MRFQTKEAQEFRLQQICRLHEAGFGQSEIAEQVTCTQAWVSQVLQRAASEGRENLRAKDSAAGNKPALQAAQLKELGRVLEQEAQAAGFATDGWTCPRIAEVIEQRFGVRHHPSHVSRLLRKMGLTRQKPQRRDYRQVPEAGRVWREETLPQLKKSND